MVLTDPVRQRQAQQTRQAQLSYVVRHMFPYSRLDTAASAQVPEQSYEALLIFATVIVSPSIFPVTFTLAPAYFARPGAF